MSHTFSLGHLPVDLDEDAGVAEGHDQQGEDVQRHKVEHVVGRLLPRVPEAPVSHTLREVHAVGFNGAKDEQLEAEGEKTDEEREKNCT